MVVTLGLLIHHSYILKNNGVITPSSASVSEAVFITKRNLSRSCDLEEKREKRIENSGGRDTRTRLIDGKIIYLLCAYLSQSWSKIKKIQSSANVSPLIIHYSSFIIH